MSVARVGRAPPRYKVEAVAEIERLLREYPVIGVARLENLPASVLQKIKSLVRDLHGNDVLLKVVKSTLFAVAARRARPEVLEKLEPLLRGQKLLVFSKLNAFALNAALRRALVPIPARPGMKATRDIVVPAGDTGLKPGPVLSSFSKLRIPTKVQGGTIWIAKDTKVAKAGDVISAELASLLQRLGVIGGEAYIELEAAVDGSTLLKKEELELDLESFRNEVSRAQSLALGVATRAAVPEPEALSAAVLLARARAAALAGAAGLLLRGVEREVIALAVARARAVVAALGDRARELGLEVPAAPAPAPAVQAKASVEEEKEKEKEAEEEKKELSEEE
ncbi:MAG: 50S ribosomal protein L10, partial [Fervidicoccaceae archaeon]